MVVETFLESRRSSHSSDSDGTDLELLSEHDCESPSSSWARDWSTGRLLRRVVAAALLTTSALFGVWMFAARSRGNAAAEAAIAAIEQLDAAELLRADAPSNYMGSGSPAALLLNRAGRGSNGERQPRPENTPLAWAEKQQAKEDAASLEMLRADFSSVVSKAAASTNANWGDEWLRQEINRGLNGIKEELNANMSQITQQKWESLGPMKGDRVQMDYFYGLDSTFIDSFECYKVVSDSDAGTAVAYVLMKAHANSPLGCGGKIASGANGGGPYYPFTIKMSNFWTEARHMRSEMTLGLPPKLEKAYVGWVDLGFSNLEATCFSKTDKGNPPTHVDGACTDFMNKKLQKEKGTIIWNMSDKLSKALQRQFDKKGPLVLENP